jgi:hypothetical protein
MMVAYTSGVTVVILRLTLSKDLGIGLHTCFLNRALLELKIVEIWSFLFFCVEYDDEGPSICTAMVILKGRGKTNQFRKPLFPGYYCHSNV